MRPKGRIVLLLLAGSLLAAELGGCGAEEKKPEDSLQPVERAEYDLAEGAWRPWEEITDSSEPWSAAGSLKGTTSDAQAAEISRCSAAEGTDFYILESFETAEGQSHELTRIDMTSLEAERTKLQLQDIGNLPPQKGAALTELAEALDAGWAGLVGLDALDGKVCLLAVCWEQGRTVRACAISVDEEGKAENMTDLLPGLEEAGMLRQGGMPRDMVRDREGHIFISGSASPDVCVLDEEGRFVTWMRTDGGSDSLCRCTCRLSDGRPVFEYGGPQDGTVTFLCLDGEREKVLYRGQGEPANARYVNRCGEILWLDYGGILRWDVAAGRCERFYQDGGLQAAECEAVLEGPEGEVTLAFRDGSVYRFRAGESGEQDQVRIFQLYADEKMKEHAAAYTREHPEAGIVVESCEPDENREIVLNRLMAQMAAGGGPDILILHRGQMELLQGKGALAELSGMLSEKLREQIFSGVLRQGSIGDGLYGIAGEVSVETLLVSDEVWAQETWTVRDVLELLEERERRGEACDRWISIPYSLSADTMLFGLALLDLEGEESALVDPARGKCQFDTPEFISLLEVCKKYGEAPDSREYMTPQERLAEVRSGKALAYLATGGLQGFSRDMAMFGAGYHCVGYPVQSGCGSLVSCYQLTAVNAKTRYPEIVGDFLNYLLSEEVQRQQGASTVRRDVLAAGVEERHPDFDNGPVFRSGENVYIPLEGKPDGTSYLQEYMELLDAGRLETWERSELRGIILEEALVFFGGGRSAEETAAVIQNRVQLYLDER